MRSRATDRSAFGVGGASLQYFDKKFHNEMLRDVKSRVASQFNDLSWRKHRSDLRYFKKDQGITAIR